MGMGIHAAIAAIARDFLSTVLKERFVSEG